MTLSIVTTLYDSAPYLEQFYLRTCAATEQITRDYEIILVNDGSPDNSLDIAISIHRRDKRVRVIDLSRNFGHHKAMMTGLAHARGELVFLVDSDLEEEPELLNNFYEQLQRTGADVVFGVQQKRKGRLFERISGSLYFKVFNLFSTYPIPWALTGFNQVPITVRKHHKARSAYGLRRKLSHLVNAVTSFSNKPLVLIFYLGCFILLVSSIAAADMIIRKLLFGTLLQGWASLIVSVWLLGGLTIFCLGVIGIYLAKVFIEVKQRPYTIVKRVFEDELFPFGKPTLDDELAEEGKGVHELR